MTLRTRLSAADLTLSRIQFYQHFLNSLPAEYDWAIAVHDPIPSNYSIDTLCERIRAIEPRKELRTTSRSLCSLSRRDPGQRKVRIQTQWRDK